jgi:hypothetical protein
LHDPANRGSDHAPEWFTGGVDELGRMKESITRHAGHGLKRTRLPGVSVVCAPTTTEPLGDMVEPTLGSSRRASRRRR